MKPIPAAARAILALAAVLSSLPAAFSQAPEPVVPVKPAAPAAETSPPTDKKAASRQSDQTAASVKTDAEVEGLLFFASDEQLPSAATPEAAADEKQLSAAFMEDIRSRLGRTHPYQSYQLLGRHTQKVFKEYESWVVPSKELCLKVDSRGPTEDKGVQLHVQLWQEKKVLVKSDVKLAPDRPIIIGGPKWRKGRLIFVLSQKSHP